MPTFIIGTIVIGLAAFIIYRKTRQLASGNSTCACSDCSSCGCSCSKHD